MLRIWVVEPPLPAVSGVRGVRDVRLWGPDDPDDDPDGPADDRPGGGAPDPENPDPHGSGGDVPRIPTPPEAETTVRETGGESDGLLRNSFNLLAKPEDVPALVEEIEAAEVVALDLETTGLDSRQDKIRLLSLVTPGGIWLIDCSAVDPGQILVALAGKSS